MQNPEVLGQPPNLPIIALEGLGGAGKTHISNLLQSRFSSEGIESNVFKIGGLGFGNRLDQLRRIRMYREEVFRSGTETKKQREDRLADRVYSLAARFQTKGFISTRSDRLTILDRTPFVGWAYTAANQKAIGEENPYLEDIFQDNLTICKMLDLDQVYYLDVSPETAYARTLSRYFVNNDYYEETLDQIIGSLQAPADKAKLIKQMTVNIISGDSNVQAKEFENWHFPLYPLLQAHRSTFLEVLDRGKRECGYEIVVIDAEANAESVAREIHTRVLQRISS